MKNSKNSTFFRLPSITRLLVLAFLTGYVRLFAAERFVSPYGTHVEPFTDWATAATNIQAAIDASSGGDVIWVTNGVYSFGGKVMAGDLTNRVCLDKPLTLRSVNGPFVTAIEGAAVPNGYGAVRCAWVTNGAALAGFTLRRGATRLSTDPNLGSGGGVWCTSADASVLNCVIISNTAASYGSGALGGTFWNSLFTGNQASFGAACSNVLINCTVLSNLCRGTYGTSATNSLMYFNSSDSLQGPFAYCCAPGPPPGIGNINALPQVLPDGIHLANTSPCRDAGTNLTLGTDIDGQVWETPPSIGCDQWEPLPAFHTPPKLRLTGDPVGFVVEVDPLGLPPFTCWWNRDGTPVEDDGHYGSSHSTSLTAYGLRDFDAGGYQLVVSNSFGMATSSVAQLVFHYVDGAGSQPAAPYQSWASAATNIQDAIDASSAGEVVYVTNGTYASGGKVIGGTLLNRVAVNKAVIVHSANGPSSTMILGASDPLLTNGPTSVRCAWLTTNAVMVGFTLRGGATRPRGGDQTDGRGGGVYGTPSAKLVDCRLTGNSAALEGGAAWGAALIRCGLYENTAWNGGAAGNCSLRNSLLSNNYASSSGGALYMSTAIACALTKNRCSWWGGGADTCTLINCTITENSASNPQGSANGGGVSHGTLTNCIIWQNFCGTPGGGSNYYTSTLSFCCSSPLSAGTGNIDSNPQLLGDGVHLTISSPCRNTGLQLLASSEDIDGQLWANPPAIGCDEWAPSPLIPADLDVQVSGVPPSLTVSAEVVTGQGPFAFQWYKDGLPLDENDHYTAVRTTNLVANLFGPLDAGRYQLVASNAFGLATSAVAQVVVHCVDSTNPNSAPPYAVWSTAASNIQDAIDLALDKAIILVTNGLYATGGRAMAGDLTNRVAVTKPLLVISANGPTATAVEGAWDPATANGPLAVRCAWLTNGATLSGFTLQHGATRASGDALTLGSGGGVWAASTNATVLNCVIVSNTASYGGGACNALLNNCTLRGNWSSLLGGGAYNAALRNSYVRGNSAGSSGGGVYGGNLVNCTLVANSAAIGRGACEVTARNCLIYYNWAVLPSAEWAGFSTFSSCCTTPLPSGIGNITADPQLIDGLHLTVTSPCRAAGTPLYSSGTDVDNEPWANPPSIGCDEVWDANIKGPLEVSLIAEMPAVVVDHNMPLTARVLGRASRVAWDYGDGSVLTNESRLGTLHAWTNTGEFTVTFSAFNADFPAGVSTNLLVAVVPLVPPILSGSGLTTNGFGLSFTGQQGVTYVLQATTNLAAPLIWEYVRAFFGNGKPLQVTDTRATNNMRFYRVLVQ